MTLDAEVQIDRKVKKYGGHVSKGDVESTETTGPGNLESDWKPTKEVFLILLCLSIIAIMASLDMTIFLSILPASVLLIAQTTPQTIDNSNC